MSTIFPGSASVGQIYNNYTFDGTAWNINGIDLTENYLEESSASATYLTQVNASTIYATKVYADSAASSASAAAVSYLVDSAPSTLNTLNELAAALGDDANYASTITTALGNKLDASSASTTYLTQSSASTTYLTQTSAYSTYAPTANPTFTGTVSGVTKSMVGLGNVDNTSDANKPVSSATQTALNAKAPTADPTITGTMSAGIINTTGDISGGGWVGGVTSDGAGRGLLVRQSSSNVNNAIIQFTNNPVNAQLASITAGSGGQLSMNSTTAFWGCIQTNTVAGQAVVVTSDGQLRRTSSSSKYKNSIEDLDHEVADRVLNLRPVWFKSNDTNIDNPEEWSYVGLIAEEVAQVEPRLALFKKAEIVYDELGNQKFNEDGSPLMIELETPEPEGVKYAEISVYLLDIIKREKARSDDLEQRVIELEQRLNITT